MEARLAMDILDSVHVVTVPGSVFGQHGEGYLRLSYGSVELSDLDPLFLTINISTHLPYLLIEPAFNIRKPKFQLFQEIYNQTVYDITVQYFDKQITLELEKYRICIVFYGSQPNIFIIDLYNSIVNSFKSGEIPDNLPSKNIFDFRDTVLDLSDFKNADSINSYLKTKFNALNKTIINEIIFRYNQADTLNMFHIRIYDLLNL